MENDKKVLVTGGTGFIGSSLVRKLLKMKFDVTIASISDIEQSPIKDLKNEISFYKMDLTNQEETKRLIKNVNPSIIIHLAAKIDLRRDPEIIESMMKDNFFITLNIYRASLSLDNIKCIITLGSAEEYGQNKAPFNEKQKEMPVSPYSLSKTCMTYLSSYFCNIHKIPIVVLRPSVVYGENQTSKQFIPYIITKCLKNEPIDMTKGEQTRDFIYVGDLSDAIIKISKNPTRVIGKVMNICTGEKIRIRDAAFMIKKYTKSKTKMNIGAIKYREGENMHFYCSNKKANSLLNWSPKYPFKKGIKKTIEWYKQNNI